jgi:DNA-binding transcriptional ArsR family regulator
MRKQYLRELPPDWRPAAGIFAALGDETRQKILLIFEPGDELSIKEIVALFPLCRTSMTHHLGVLERAGILVVRREGRRALYQPCYAPVLDALKRLCQLIVDDLKAAKAQRRPVREKTQKQAKPKTKTQKRTKPKERKQAEARVKGQPLGASKKPPQAKREHHEYR